MASISPAISAILFALGPSQPYDACDDEQHGGDSRRREAFVQICGTEPRGDERLGAEHEHVRHAHVGASHSERLQHGPGEKQQGERRGRPRPREAGRQLHEEAAHCVRRRRKEEERKRHMLAVRGDAYLLVAGGASNCRATRRELFLIARDALVMLMVARETASTSTPTLNASRMLLPRNCAANSGRSIEKSPYGSWCSTTTTPVRM